LADSNEALVSLDRLPWERNSPWAPTPRAWTTRSGVRSRSNRASFWISWKLSRRTAPSGPAVLEFWLLPTGWPPSSVRGLRGSWAVARAAEKTRPSVREVRIVGEFSGWIRPIALTPAIDDRIMSKADP